ncbi:MAG: 4-(cytidine 5'-diphospho)-2-C-methyl-D-erythritol kinase [Bauldia sp.]
MSNERKPTAAAPAIAAPNGVEPAPAKVNLALNVTGRGDDGYHALDTLAVFAAMGDIVRGEVDRSGAIATDVIGPFAEDIVYATAAGENLAERAARALAAAYPKRKLGVALTLDKRLPVASGLGGGSSDAAATLRLLDRLWGLDAETADLHRIALTLGSDVPMCLEARPTRATGRGEKLAPIAGMPRLALLLVNPGVPVATATIFKRLAPPFDPPLPALPAAFKSVFELVIWLRQSGNRLEEPAIAEAPVIARALKVLKADTDCLLARMTGSGATCFGIFASLAAAQRAEVRMRASRPDWWVVATETVKS